MYKLFSIIMLLAGYVLSVPVAGAITIDDTQGITSNGQSFTFEFTSLPASNGTGGTFFVHLNGDYTDGASENALITLDLAADTLLLGPDGVVDGAAGLTLTSFNTTVFDPTLDVLLAFTFDISPGLLDILLADKVIRVDVLNDLTVSAVSEINPDFVHVGFTYSAVPVPAAVWLFGSGLMGLVGMARKKTA